MPQAQDGRPRIDHCGRIGPHQRPRPVRFAALTAPYQATRLLTWRQRLVRPAAVSIPIDEVDP
jgi:hypothetical protein